MAESIQEEIEDKIIDCINTGVGGRLVIFKPDKKGFEDFLAVERRGNYKEKEIYFQVNALAGPLADNNFVKDFLQESFKSGNNFYSLFVYFDEVGQKLNDFVWLVPSLQFKEIAEATQSTKGKKLLRFRSPLDKKVKNQYSKYIVKTEYLGDLILDALEKGGKFDFKYSFDDKKAINLESLKEFLCEARRNTFASIASPVDNPRLLASKQLEFQKGDYSYRDVYFDGRKNFIGQEIVYLEAKPVWGMNYFGRQIGKVEIDFLKESLFKLADKCRLGGSCEYEKREFKYQDKGEGSLEEFSGKEEIFSQNKSVYSLEYNGGLL